jgi:hypothetical protein
MDISQQAFMSGMMQQFEKQAMLDPVGAILGPIQAMQAKKGQGWAGLGHGLSQGSSIGTGAGLGGLLGLGLGSALGGSSDPKNAFGNLALLIPMLAGAGLGGYGGHRMFKNVIGPQRQAEIFGEDDSDEYDYSAPLQKDKEGHPDYWAGLPKKKKGKEKQASKKDKKAQKLWGALSGGGKGKGQPNGGRRNINLEPCPSGGPGEAKGKGKGKGKNR